MTDGKNPCDLCKVDCFDVDCPLYDLEANYCRNSECMLNFEGEACLIGIRCGASGQLEEMDEEEE